MLFGKDAHLTGQPSTASWESSRRDGMAWLEELPSIQPSPLGCSGSLAKGLCVCWQGLAKDPSPSEGKLVSGYSAIFTQGLH